MKDIKEIKYCMNAIDDYMRKIRDIDNIISHLDTIICDAVYYYDALKYILSNNRETSIYAIFIEQLKDIAEKTRKNIACHEERLKRAVNDGEEPFTSGQLCFIRDEFACIMEQTDNKNGELDIINACNRMLDCPTFESYEQFKRNASGTWEEIKEEEE